MSTAGQSRAQSIQSEASQTNAPTSIDPTKPPTSAATVASFSSKVSGKSPARIDQPSESTSPSTPEDSRNTRQVIAVSASKGPAVFFNLSRKFLVTDEEVDLSALEGAIVSAVDAAHLLERSKLATIVRVQTSYVSVEPKRRKAARPSIESPSSAESGSLHPSGEPPVTPPALSLDLARVRGTGFAPARELRRSRIIITMRRTDSYRQWLEDNPLQAMAAREGGGDEDEEDVVGEEGVVEEAQNSSL